MFLLLLLLYYLVITLGTYIRPSLFISLRVCSSHARGPSSGVGAGGGPIMASTICFTAAAEHHTPSSSSISSGDGGTCLMLRGRGGELTHLLLGGLLEVERHQLAVLGAQHTESQPGGQTVKRSRHD